MEGLTGRLGITCTCVASWPCSVAKCGSAPQCGEAVGHRVAMRGRGSPPSLVKAWLAFFLRGIEPFIDLHRKYKRHQTEIQTKHVSLIQRRYNS
jgi:hypothetical protein